MYQRKLHVGAVVVYPACGSGNPVRLLREEYCVYIGDNDFGLYNKNGIKASKPFGMLAEKVFGDSGSIKIKIAKALLNNVPAIRYTITTTDPQQPQNPDSLWQGGSSATDVFPGTPATFGGEINGYGEISGNGILSATEYTIYYVYDGINPIVEYAPNGSVLARYIYAGGMHIAKIAGADTSFYLTDAIGSARKMINEDMGNAWTGQYYPFGELTVSSSYPTPRDNTHGFTGKELDSEMGLNYFCQRYYDPQIGRFMSLDPQDSPASSPYAYCANNPLRRIDPLGTSWDDFQGALYHEWIPWDFSEEEWSWIESNMMRYDRSRSADMNDHIYWAYYRMLKLEQQADLHDAIRALNKIAKIASNVKDGAVGNLLITPQDKDKALADLINEVPFLAGVYDVTEYIEIEVTGLGGGLLATATALNENMTKWRIEIHAYQDDNYWTIKALLAHEFAEIMWLRAYNWTQTMASDFPNFETENPGHLFACRWVERHFIFHQYWGYTGYRY